MAWLGRSVSSTLSASTGLRFRLLLATLLLLPTPGFGAEEENDYPPGLLARYTAGGKSIERVDSDVAFVWEESPPDARLPAGDFEVAWNGLLLVRPAGKFRLHAFLQGELAVTLNGKPALAGRRAEADWLSGDEITLEFGEQPLEIRFRKTEPAARLQLFWSSDSFRLEPIPASALFQAQQRPEFATLDRGRELFAAQRCNRCHQRPQDPPAPLAPGLDQVGSGLDRVWLVQWLQKPASQAAHARMPEFGFSAQEAEAVAAFLCRAPRELKPPEFKPQEREKLTRQGELLFRTLGCLACHTRDESGSAEAWSGGDLTQISRKRSAAWLRSWLLEPRALNADHRMPQFDLTPAEILQLTLFLAGPEADIAQQPSAPAEKPDPAQVAAGRQLVEAARCAACHRIPGVEAKTAGLPSLEQPVADWSRSCLQPNPDRRTFRPAYPGIDRPAVMAYVNSRAGPLAPESRFDRGERVLASNNCLACHARGESRGIVATAGALAQLDPDLKGQSEALIPPSLNAVGDKLFDEALALAVSGKQPERRLPWLRVRMPRFEHAPADKQVLTAYLVGHDRIPEPTAALAAQAQPPAAEPQSAEARAKTLLAGHALVGGQGFSCVACHRFGKFEPRNVALGTRGSDLLQPARRMRESYFVRWTRSPLRIVHDMEMPSFERPVAGILDGDIDRQLAALWAALNDPQFTVPVDPSVIEQLFVVEPGTPARIVRDVFTLPGPDRDKYVSRSFAVGFGNQHSLLFDLDTLQVREWWLGDFSRQRTQGKSWYWDVAGVPLVKGFEQLPDLALHADAASHQPVLLPLADQGAAARLRSYAPQGAGVVLHYEVDFQTDQGRQTLQVAETDLPLAHDGWRRQIDVTGVPLGYNLLFSRQPLTALLGNAAIEPAGPWESFSRIGPKNELTKTEYCRLKPGPTAGTATLAIDYRSSARPAALSQKLPELPPPAAETLDVIPGFDAVRLSLPASIMPTALTWTARGELAITSLKGHVYVVRDTDGDGLEDRLVLFEEGLAAPYGIIADGSDLLVAHKPELLRLRDTDGDGRADRREVIASGWGYNDNYHDWTCGIVRDSQQNLYVGLGSDYAQLTRDRHTIRWRGKVLRISPTGKITPVGSGFRYPTGLAITPDDQIFVSDNQGVQNTFNEINHLVDGGRYGVPSLEDGPDTAPPLRPAIQVPHPWTRSINGLFFLNPPAGAAKFGPFAGHGIGCEYDSRFLIRFTVEQVGGTFQGAAYPLSLQKVEPEQPNFEGTLCGGVSPRGEIYIGCIHDSGWLGGRNVGSIVRLRPNGKLPPGIREIQARPEGFAISFTQPIAPTAAADPANYSISAYTRVWQGAYATPDSERHKVTVESVQVAADGLSATLKATPLREGFVYEITCGKISANPEQTLWPATGHYTLNRISTSTAK
jgi:mono/diheme cytochrome c family protein